MEGRKLQGRYPDEGTVQCTRTEEGLSKEGREQGRKGSKGGEKTSKEVSRRGHRPVYSIFTKLKPFHKAALGLETLVLQMKNSEQVYIINSVL